VAPEQIATGGFSRRIDRDAADLLLLVHRRLGLGGLLRRDHGLLFLIRVVRPRLLLRGLLLNRFRRSVAHGNILSLSCLTFGIFVFPKALVVVREAVRRSKLRRARGARTATAAAQPTATGSVAARLV